MKKTTKGLLAIPHTGSLPWETAEAIRMLDVPDNVEIVVGGIAGSVVHIGREAICAMAKKDGYDWVLMIDSDMVPEQGLIKKMLDANLPVVSAPCFKRTAPYTPCFYDKLEIKNGAVDITPCTAVPFTSNRPIQVQAVGAACILIHREVLEKIEAPYFFPLPTAGEDISFCLRLQKAGIPIHVLPNIRCGHIGTKTIFEEDFVFHRAQFGGDLK